jgi:cytochrome c biogenesis protein CcmG/thiol:disulfide interchange protein DsbE
LTKSLAIALLALLMLSSPAASADEALDIAQYEGKVVVLDFWASWCVPCRRSFPWWNTMHAKYADEGLIIIGVNLDNDLQDAAKFLDEYSADFRIHYDKDKVLAKQYGVQAMPSTYILGRDGELIARHFGFKVKQQEEYEAVLIEALRDGE